MKHHLARWLMLLLVPVLLITAGCSGPSGQPEAARPTRTVRIAYLPITHALPLFQEKEMETADGPVHVELIRYGSWPELMDALNTGKVDGASVLIELAVKAREQGIDIRAAALGHRDGNVIIAGKDIATPEDLKGKIFAIPHKQSSHKLLLDQMLQEHGMTEKDLTVVEMSPPEMPAGLAQGQIAGYCVAEPFGAKAILNGNGHVLTRSDELWPDSVCCALVFNGQFLDNHHDLAKAMVHEYLAAGRYLTAHPESQLATAQKYLKAKGPVLDLSFQWISYDDLALKPKAYQDLTQRMVDTGLIKTVPPYAEFVDTSLLDDSQDERS